MLRRWSLTVWFAAAVAAASPLLAGVATAADVTPNGFVGACNMVRSWPGVGPGVPDGGGMLLAMGRDAAAGNTGMTTAVLASSSASSCK